MDENQEKSEVLSVIGKNIKQARLLRDLTQESLAEKLNKSTNFVSLIERGVSGVSLSTLVDICNVLQVDISVIFNGLISSSHTEDTEYLINTISMFNDSDKAIVTSLVKYIINSKK